MDYIEDAWDAQAWTYANALPEGRPPAIVVVDIGYGFWVGRKREEHGYPALRSPETKHFSLRHLILGNEDAARILLDLFEEPEFLDPSRIQEAVTKEVSEALARVARPLQARVDAGRAARFLIRCLFCMFAEDVDLLPPRTFSKIVDVGNRNTARFAPLCEQLFTTMRDGGLFSLSPDDDLSRFNGSLFTDGHSRGLATSASEFS